MCFLNNTLYKIILVLIFVFLTSLKPAKIFAQVCTLEPTSMNLGDICKQFDSRIYEQFKLKVAKSELAKYSDAYNRIRAIIWSDSCAFKDGSPVHYNMDTISDPNYVIFSFPKNSGCTYYLADTTQAATVQLNYDPGPFDSEKTLCSLSLNFTPNQSSCNIAVSWNTGGIGDVNSNWQINIDNINPAMNYCQDQRYIVTYPNALGDGTETDLRRINLRDPYWKDIKTIAKAATYKVTVVSATGQLMCSKEFNVAAAGATPAPIIPSPTLSITPTLAPGAPTYTPVPPLPKLSPLCDQLGEFKAACLACQGDPNATSGKIWTALGCISTDIGAFVRDIIFGIGLGIAGGIAFLYFIYGAFLILTSAGVAERVAQGKEIIVSALIGLLFIIFSIFLLKIIGIDILKIPGFR